MKRKGKVILGQVLIFRLLWEGRKKVETSVSSSCSNSHNRAERKKNCARSKNQLLEQIEETDTCPTGPEKKIKENCLWDLCVLVSSSKEIVESLVTALISAARFKKWKEN